MMNQKQKHDEIHEKNISAIALKEKRQKEHLALKSQQRAYKPSGKNPGIAFRGVPTFVKAMATESRLNISKKLASSLT